MRRAKFCPRCGTRLTTRPRWFWLDRTLCADCAQRLGRANIRRPFILIILFVTAAFAFGRWLRPPPPPLIIQRAANSPLPDSPLKTNDALIERRATNPITGNTSINADDPVYICGARTKKGTPCHRRVHVAGERCFQHKGMTAMLALDKLKIADGASPRN